MKKRTTRSLSLGDKPKPTPSLDLLKKPQTFVGINNEWAFQAGSWESSESEEFDPSSKLSVEQVFDAWAQVGKDEEFEASNKSCKTFLKMASIPKTEFSLVDLGCSNGWLLQWFYKHFPLAKLTGVDVSPQMIKKAGCRVDESIKLVCSDFSTFKPEKPFDIVFCMSSLYYVVPMETFSLANLAKPGTLFICGTDCFLENEVCHSWPAMLNLEMDIRSIASYRTLFIESYGLNHVEQVCSTKCLNFDFFRKLSRMNDLPLELCSHGDILVS